MYFDIFITHTHTHIHVQITSNSTRIPLTYIFLPILCSLCYLLYWLMMLIWNRYRTIHSSVVNQPRGISLNKLTFPPLPLPVINCSSARGEDSSLLPPSMLECWMTWFYVGLAQAASDIMSSLVQWTYRIKKTLFHCRTRILPDL